MVCRGVLILALIIGAALMGGPTAWAGSSEMTRMMKTGRQAFQAADYLKALAAWQQGLDAARNAGDRPSEAEFLDNLGLACDALGQYQRSLTFHEQALALYRELQDRAGQARVHHHLGLVQRHLSRYDPALEQHRRALDIFRELGDRRGEGRALGLLGLVNWFLGRYEQALEDNQKALTLLRGVQDRQGEGQVLQNLGVEYFRLGQYEQALAYLRQALAIHRELGDLRQEANDLVNLGEAHQEAGQYEEALACNRQALAIHRRIKTRRGEGQALSNLAAIYVELGRYPEALTCHRQALAIHRETGNRVDEGAVLTSLALLQERLGQLDRARRTALAGVRLCREVGQPENLWRAQRARGRVEVRLGLTQAAVEHYLEALDTIESLRRGLGGKDARAAYMKNKLFVYDELIDLLRRLHDKDPGRGHDRKSLEIFERKQGRLFLEEMGLSGARTFAGLPEEVRAEELALENSLAALQSLQARLAREHPDYYALKYPRPAGVAEIQEQVLRPGEVLLVYGVMEQGACLWVVGPQDFALLTLNVGEKALADRIQAFNRDIQAVLAALNAAKSPAAVAQAVADSLGGLRQQSRELYDLLLPAAARSLVAGKQTVYIVPTGPLYELPFEALETQAAGRPARVFLEDHAVAYLSSASLLKVLRDAQTRRDIRPTYPLLAFAHAVYPEAPDPRAGQPQDENHFRGLRHRAYRQLVGQHWPELEETQKEVEEIRDILKAPGDSQPLHLREQASRGRVLELNRERRLSLYRYVVFACHGVLPGEVSHLVQSALVLSHPEQDGYLTMGDVFGLTFNADLVTLSACKTGRGTAVKGEGVMGLTRAFMFAGTPAVAVTLWSVESQSAKDLNVGLHRYLSQGLSRAEALRRIKLDMGQGGARFPDNPHYAHPVFWAPLVIFGDGR
jgi:CHAT domain-containing protein/Flp pilus assembly protein TadD